METYPHLMAESQVEAGRAFAMFILAAKKISCCHELRVSYWGKGKKINLGIGPSAHIAYDGIRRGRNINNMQIHKALAEKSTPPHENRGFVQNRIV